MRKLRFAPLAALALGAAGAVLRNRELASAFEENGLHIPWAGMTVALAALTALTAAASLALAAVTGRRFTSAEDFRRAFRVGNYVSFALMAALGAAVVVCAALTVREGAVLGLSGMARWVFLALLALGGAGMVTMACSAYTQRESSFLKLGSVMPSVLFCYWMVALYRVNAGNPVLLDYCWSALAFGAASVSAYYVAGYAFGRKNLAGTVASGLIAIYLLTVALADPAPWTLRAVIAATALFITLHTTHLLTALEPQKPEGEK